MNESIVVITPADDIDSIVSYGILVKALGSNCRVKFVDFKNGNFVLGFLSALDTGYRGTYFLDCSPEKKNIERVKEEKKPITIIDHHSRTAEIKSDELVNVVYSEDMSTARMTLDHFRENIKGEALLPAFIASRLTENKKVNILRWMGVGVNRMIAFAKRERKPVLNLGEKIISGDNDTWAQIYKEASIGISLQNDLLARAKKFYDEAIKTTLFNKYVHVCQFDGERETAMKIFSHVPSEVDCLVCWQVKGSKNVKVTVVSKDSSGKALSFGKNIGAEGKTDYCTVLMDLENFFSVFMRIEKPELKVVVGNVSKRRTARPVREVLNKGEIPKDVAVLYGFFEKLFLEDTFWGTYVDKEKHARKIQEAISNSRFYCEQMGISTKIPYRYLYVILWMKRKNEWVAALDFERILKETDVASMVEKKKTGSQVTVSFMEEILDKSLPLWRDIRFS